MPRPVAGSRLAVILRRLRGRFGISAPQLSIRTHVPWHLRVASVVGAVLLVLALAGWAYDAGRRMAGFDQSETGHVVNELRSTNAAQEEEINRLRSLLSGSESNLQIEQATQKLLTEKNASLIEENAKLKEELAVFERLARLEGKGGEEVSIDRLSVRAEAPGRYRYSFLIALQGQRRGKESKLNLQLVVSPANTATGAKVTFPKNGMGDASQYEIVLRNFRRIEGKFELSPEFSVGSVEIRVLEAGQLKTSKSATLEENQNVRKNG